MNTTSLNISLPEPLHAFIESEVAEGGYGTASEYIRALLRDAQQRKVDQALEAYLMEGLNGSNGDKLTAEEWENRKQQYCEQRLQELRKEIAIGLEQLERGEGIPAEDVFKRLRERNQRLAEKRK